MQDDFKWDRRYTLVNIHRKKKSHSLNEQKEFDQCLLSGISNNDCHFKETKLIRNQKLFLVKEKHFFPF